MHGPWGFNDTDREGLLTYGFEERSTYATNYYYPYFAKNMVDSNVDADRIFDINLKGVFNCCKSATPVMVNQKSGKIINISSMWGQVGASCEVAYSASKAGVIGLTKALAKEVAPSNIRVNCVAPGVVMTDMMQSFDEETLKELTEETPLQKLGTPKNIADAVVFLASSKAEFITGQVLGVNGGFII